MEAGFKQFVQQGMIKAKKMGATAVEFYLAKSKAQDIQIKNSAVEETKLAENRGVSVRLIKDNRLGFSFSSDFSAQALDRMLHQAVTNACFSDQNRFLAMPSKTDSYPQAAIYDETLAKRSLSEKIDLALTVENIAQKADKRIIQIERSGYEDGETEVWLANSNGLYGYQKSSYCGLYALALASDGNSHESGYGMDIAVDFDQLSAKKVGEMAALKATRLLGAKNIKTQSADLVLDPQVATQILNIIASGFSGENMLKGRSLFHERLHQPVASQWVTIIDDGTMDHHLGTIIFDGEGTAAQKTILVENGVLKNYLHNVTSANEAHTHSTGNGLRGSYKGMPSIGVTNYYLAAGTVRTETLIRQVKTGLYVTEILGAHTADGISGDFSFGASGLWIENGHFVKPIRGATIAGNLKDLLFKIDGVADDLTFFGASGAPTIKIAQMMISGE